MARTKIRGGLNLVYNQISEKPVAPPLDIPSRSPNRIGAERLGLIRVLFNYVDSERGGNWVELGLGGTKLINRCSSID